MTTRISLAGDYPSLPVDNLPRVIGMEYSPGLTVVKFVDDITPQDTADINALVAGYPAYIAAQQAIEATHTLAILDINQQQVADALAAIALDIAALENVTPPSAAAQRQIVVRMLILLRKIIKYEAAQAGIPLP